MVALKPVNLKPVAVAGVDADAETSVVVAEAAGRVEEVKASRKVSSDTQACD